MSEKHLCAYLEALFASAEGRWLAVVEWRMRGW